MGWNGAEWDGMGWYGMVWGGMGKFTTTNYPPNHLIPHHPPHTKSVENFWKVRANTVKLYKTQRYNILLYIYIIKYSLK